MCHAESSEENCPENWTATTSVGEAGEAPDTAAAEGIMKCPIDTVWQRVKSSSKRSLIVKHASCGRVAR